MKRSMHSSLLTLAGLLPASTLAAVIARAPQLPSDVSVPDNGEKTTWKYIGCFPDSVSSRTLSATFMFSDNLTPESCAEYCNSKGYNIAGTEYSAECYCGLGLDPRANDYPNEECNMPCSGDKNVICGGPDRLSVYVAEREPPIVNPGTNGYVSIGCFDDSVQDRTLVNLAQVPGGSDALTVSACTATCSDMGFIVAGVEYGGECFCGDKINDPEDRHPHGYGADGCNMPCKGNFSEICGGADKINVYGQPSAWPSASSWSIPPWASTAPPWWSSTPTPSSTPFESTPVESTPVESTPVESSTPYDTPSSTPYDTPSTPYDTPSSTPYDTPSTPYDTPSSTPYDTPSSTPENTPSSTPYDTTSSSPYDTPSSLYDTPSSIPYDTPSSTPEDTPSSTPYDTPLSTPYDTPSSTPDVTPSSTPDVTPSSWSTPHGRPHSWSTPHGHPHSWSTPEVSPPFSTPDVPPESSTPDVPTPSSTSELPPFSSSTPELPPFPSSTPDVPPISSTPDIPSYSSTPEVPPYSSSTPEVPPFSSTPEVPPFSSTPEVPPPSSTPEIPSSSTPEVPPFSSTPEVPAPSSTPEIPYSSTPEVPPYSSTSEVSPPSSTPIIPSESSTPVVPPPESTPQYPSSTPRPSPSWTIVPTPWSSPPSKSWEQPWKSNPTASPDDLVHNGYPVQPGKTNMLTGKKVTATDWVQAPNPNIPDEVGLSGFYRRYGTFYSYEISASADTFANFVGSKSLCISQNVTIPKAGDYAISARMGRTYTSEDNDGWMWIDTDYAILVDGGVVKSGDVCNPRNKHECSTKAPGGGGFSTVSIAYTAKDACSVDLSICAVFTSNNVHGYLDPPDSFFVSTVSFK